MADGRYFDSLETRSAEAREGALMARLPRLVEQALASAPGWVRRLAGVDPQTVCTRRALAQLPVLRKAELARLQAAEPPFGGLVTQPTGELGALYCSAALYQPEERADDPWRAARALHAAGVRRGQLLLNAFSYHRVPRAWMVHYAARRLGCAVIPAGADAIDEQLGLITRLRPQVWAGTPSLLRQLVEQAQARGVDLSGLRCALVAGEALPEALRSWFLEQGIGAVRQWYGTADVGLIAYESEAQDGLLLDEDLVLEIVRPGTGEPLVDGEIGEVVITSFSPVYPLLRFGTGDLSAVLRGPSPCGRTNLRLCGWLGRADQSVEVRGRAVQPGQLAELQRRFPEVERLRLLVRTGRDGDALTLRCEPAIMPPELGARVLATLRELTGLEGSIECLARGTLPADGVLVEDGRPRAT